MQFDPTTWGEFAPLDVETFEARMDQRRAARRSYRRKLAGEIATLAGTVLWMLIVVWVVWGIR